MNKVLIVIDLQNDFVTGSLGTKEAIAIVPKIKNYVNKCVGEFYNVFFTRDRHDEDFYKYTIEGQYVPEHCIDGTEGTNVVDGLNRGYIFNEIKKGTFAYLNWEEWFLTSPDIIEIVGVCTDICVISNALVLRSLFPRARIVVHSDMCAGTTPEKHLAALEVMKSCLIEVD